MLIRDIIIIEAQYSPEQAREIGSCAVIGMSHVTGLSWEQVWEHAKHHFGRWGMNAGDIGATMRELGWRYGDKSYWKLLGVPRGTAMTVQQAQAYLITNDPDVRLLCTIKAGGVPHTIAFADGQFHNVQGAWNARLRLAYYCEKP